MEAYESLEVSPTDNNTTHEILDLIDRIENLSYLELGVGNGINFGSIKCKDKTSVDINPGTSTWTGTTDKFFEELDKDKKFDIIFIDACHEYSQVVKDYNNAISHCNKFIFMHDMVPQAQGYVDERYCWDCYKILYYFFKETKMNPIIWDEPTSQGLTLLLPPFEEIDLKDDYKNTSYITLMELLKEKKRYSRNEIIKIIKEKM